LKEKIKLSIFFRSPLKTRIKFLYADDNTMRFNILKISFLFLATIEISKSSIDKYKWTTHATSANADGNTTAIFGTTECGLCSTGCIVYDAGTRWIYDNDARTAFILRRPTMGLPGWIDTAARYTTEETSHAVAGS
jgi:hypothetical protein